MSLKWSEAEFQNAELGDKRLTDRLIQLAASFAQNPKGSIPQSTIEWKRTKAAYRFFDNEKVQVEKIHQSHKCATQLRLEQTEETILLAIQDTSEIAYHNHGALALGMGNNGGNALFLHPTLLTTTLGVPIGIIGQQIWKRKEKKEAGAYKTQKIEDKESYKWLKGFESAAEFQERNPKTTVISVCDREADVYELFQKQKQLKNDGLHLVVRSARDRNLTEKSETLISHMRKQSQKGQISVDVPRNGKRKQFTLNLAICYSMVELQPPTRINSTEKLAPLKLWVVEAKETDTSSRTNVNWRIFTTLPINNLNSALTVLKYYQKRWVIEEYFKVLKSGCAIEERQLREFDRLEKCLMLDSVVAWRILFLMYAGRELPDLPATILFTDDECNAMYCIYHKTPKPPESPITISDMMRFLAKSGGFLNRKSDGFPGAIVLWRGCLQLPQTVQMWKLFNP